MVTLYMLHGRIVVRTRSRNRTVVRTRTMTRTRSRRIVVRTTWARVGVGEITLDRNQLLI